MSRKPELKGRAARLARLLPTGGSRGQAARAPFVLLVVVLLGGGLIGLLVLNSALSEGSFQLDDLKQRTKELTDEEQALQRDIDAYSAPGPFSAAPANWAWCPAGTPPSSTPTAPSRACRAPPPPRPPRSSSPPRRWPRRPPARPRSHRPPTASPPARPHRGPVRHGRHPHHRGAAHPDPDSRQVTEVSDREPPRRRVPGPARPVRSGGGRRPGPGARPARRPGPPRPAPRAFRLGSPRPRLRMIGLALTLVLAAFVVRLLQVQAVDAGTYSAKAEQNRYVVHTLPAERGGITDRNGVALATTVDSYDITAEPTMFTREQLKVDDGPEQAAALLAPILGQDQEQLAKVLRPKNRELRYVRLARRQTPRSGTRSRT